MLIEAATEAYQSAGVDPQAVDAYWLGTFASGISGIVFAEAMKTPYDGHLIFDTVTRHSSSL